jgi:hypothetical protein
MTPEDQLIYFTTAGKRGARQQESEIMEKRLLEKGMGL